MPKVIDLPTATTMANADYFVMESSGGGTKKITKKNAVSELGTTLNAVSSATSIPSGTNTSLCNITLTPGTWVVTGQARFLQEGATYQAYIGISTSSTAVSPESGGFAQFPVMAPAGAVSAVVTRIITVSSNTPVYLIGYQGSGAVRGLQNGQSLITAVKVGL